MILRSHDEISAISLLQIAWCKLALKASFLECLAVFKIGQEISRINLQPFTTSAWERG